MAGTALGLTNPSGMTDMPANEVLAMIAHDDAQDRDTQPRESPIDVDKQDHTGGQDFTARSALGQSFKRHLDAKGNEKASECYDALPNPLKRKFREAWATSKSFEFFRESKRMLLTDEHSFTKLGRFLTVEGIAGALGNATSPVCQGQAERWAAQCEAAGPAWYEDDAWLGARRYRFIQKEELWESNVFPILTN